MRLYFWRKAALQPPSPPIYGVNLGGWLVLEKWMTPSVFQASSAVDEYSLCSEGSEEIHNRIKRHRDTFITKADFIWLKKQGIDAVRLPVGYWVFGDQKPYFGTIEYVDKAFQWAEQSGVKILLDMHGVPGSQNGWDHSGKSGAVEWHKAGENAKLTLEVLTKLTLRYKASPALLGIEFLNEPKWTVPRRKLLPYYREAYKMIRNELGDKPWIVFHDNFRPRRWKRKLKSPDFIHMYIDTHQYQTFNRSDRNLDMAGHMRKTLKSVPKTLRKMAKHHQVIVGEWSLALDPLSLQGLNPAQIVAARRAYGSAQIIAYERTAAWFFWSYKTEDGGHSNPWSFRDCIEQGWLPSFAEAHSKK